MFDTRMAEPVVAITLAPAQLDAARKLHGRLKQWRDTDAALAALHHVLPGFESDAALLKVAAIDQLYGTNVLAVSRMAEHVSVVMKKGVSGVALVEEIATLRPAAGSDGTTRKHVSFASKFAHFFVSPDYAIYDSYAVQALARHIKGARRSGPSDYARFVEEIDLLKSASGLACSTRDMDRYLWLVGLRLSWLKATMNNRDAPINVEVKQMFKSAESDAELRDLVARLDDHAQELEPSRR